MKKRCFIVGAGDYCERVAPESGDFVIAADGGYYALISRGIVPDLVIGDFDSLGYIPDHHNVIHSPAQKDDTDMMLAVKQGLMRGCDEFVINGGTGDRADHTFANYQVLSYIASQGARAYLVGAYMTATVIKNSSITFRSAAKDYVSAFCFGSDAAGVSLRGLKYSLENATLTSTYPLGVSNEFIGTESKVEVLSGTLLIIWEGGIDIIMK